MSFRISSRTDTIRYNRFAVWVTGWFARFFVSAVSRGIGAGSRSFSQYLRAENRSCGPVWVAIRLSRSVPIFDQDSSLSFEGRSCACVRFADTRKVILIFCCSFLSWTPLDRLLKTVYRLAYGRRNRTRKAEDEKEKEDVPHSNPLLKVFNRIRSHDILWKLLWHRLDASLSRPHISYIEPRVTIPDRTTQAQTDTQ